MISTLETDCNTYRTLICVRLSNTMKRRGRPKKIEGDVRDRNLTFRTRAGLRDRLAGAADASRRSISEEVEYRLERSFDYNNIDDAVRESFMRYLRLMVGSEENMDAMIVFVNVLMRCEKAAKSACPHGQSWIESETSRKKYIELMEQSAPRIASEIFKKKGPKKGSSTSTSTSASE